MINRDRYNIIREIFEMAKRLPKDLRSRAISEACEGDEEIVRSVEELLASDDAGFPEQEAGNNTPESETEPLSVGGNEPLDTAGRYVIESHLGKGGMGEVYLATDLVLNRKVAVKTLPSDLSKDTRRLRRFEQEARALAALNHPYIVTILEFGVSREGRHFIVSEYVEGRTLRDYIHAEDPDLAERIDLIIQITSAISTAHKADIVHRDIKPENVIVRPDGFVKVLDFGLAKPLIEGIGRASDPEGRTMPDEITDPGTIMGTPAYMSPEQITGGDLDKRTDIWSIGVLLYELVEDRKPFRGSTVAHTIVEVLEKEPVPLSRCPETLRSIILKALRKEKGERYQSVDELLADLREVADDLRSDSSSVTVWHNSRLETKETLKLAWRPSREREKGSTADVGSRTSWYSLKHIRIGRAFPVSAAVITTSLLLAVSYLLLSGVDLWPWGSETRGPLKRVGITEWSSGVGELFVGASFSPDSKMIAYSSARTGRSQIWARSVNGGKDVRVTDDEFYNQDPKWSPSGEEIAYFSFRGGAGSIWRIPALGGTPVEVIGDLERRVRVRAWSKSGTIYFQDGPELYGVSVDSGEKNKKVRILGPAGMRPRVIEISEDEDRVGFVIGSENGYDLKIKNLKTNEIKVLANSKDHFTDVVWHPDGRSVLYSKKFGDTYQIVQADVGTATEQTVSTGDLHHYVKDVSREGDILYHSANEESDLWSVDIESGKQRIVANEAAAEFWGDVAPTNDKVAYQSLDEAFAAYSGGLAVRSLEGEQASVVIAERGFHPVWSPDSTQILYLKKHNDKIEIWCVSENGSKSKRLSEGDVVPYGYMQTPYMIIGSYSISWSEDGSEIVSVMRRDGLSNIWIMGADGSNSRRLSGNSNKADTYCCPFWLGGDLVFGSKEQRSAPVGERVYRIWYLNRESGAQRQIYESTEEIRLLGVDRSSRRVLFAVKSNQEATPNVPREVPVYGVSVDGGEKSALVTLSSPYFDNISLSPDSNFVAFVSREDDASAIKVVSLSTKVARTIAREQDPKILFSSLSWSDDGDFLVFGKQSSSNFISMLADTDRKEENNE